MDEVDDFLASIQLPNTTENRLADDFHQLHTATAPSYRPRGPIIFNPPPPPWSWTGRLTIATARGLETVCDEVCVSEATSPVERNRPRIASFLPSKKDLNLPKFYDTSALRLVLCLYKPAQQFARLQYSKSMGGNSLDVLVEYMGRQHLAAVVPALWDDDEVIGHLFFFPPTAEEILLAIGAPRHQGNYLTVALLFTKSSDVQRSLKCGSPFIVQRALLSPEDWRVSRLTDHEYHLALHLTRLSVDARKWAFHYPSIIWTGGDKFGWETLTLMRALSHCRAGYVDPANSNHTHRVGSVFIHVGALHDIHHLPHLAALRKRAQVRFYLYGTHPSVSPAMWGVREVFLLGGIVSFSPAALARDPWGVLDMIRNVHAHPLWACHILPQVLGLALRLVQTPLDDDLAQEEYRGAVPVGLDCVLQSLLDGQIALMSTDEFVVPPPDKTALLELCSASCDALFGKLDCLALDTAKVEALARVEIYAEMRRLQVHPAFHKWYRRYVVLDMCSREDESGIEWYVVGNLDFEDA